VLLEFAEQARLADARFAADEDRGPGALGLGAPKRFEQRREFALPSDEPLETYQRF
jgi:hypothetical protein